MRLERGTSAGVLHRQLQQAALPGLIGVLRLSGHGY